MRNEPSNLAGSDPRNAEASPTSEGRIKADRKYWFLVNLIWVCFCLLMLLFLYVVFDSRFWLKFFE